jgi:putative heme transporter
MQPAASPAGGPALIRVELNFRNLLLLFGLLLVGWLTWQARSVLVILCFSLMIMAVLHPLVHLAERHGISHSWAVALAMLSLVLVPVLIFAALSPLLISEVQGIAGSVPQLQHRVDDLLRNAGLASRVNDAVQKANLQDRLDSLAVVSAQQTVAILTDVFTIIVISGYMLADDSRIRLWLHALAPHDSERHIDPLLAGMERVVGGYIRGQVMTSALFGVFAFIVLVACGVHYPLLLAIVAFVGDIIPIFGVPVAMVITGVVALLQSTWQPAAVLVTYSIYQQVEGHVLIPRVYSRTVNMPPLLVIVATIAGGTLDGMVGILIGIPIAGAIKVVFDYIVAERTRGHEAALEELMSAPTDALGREGLKRASHEHEIPIEPEIGPDGEIEPTYSPFEHLPDQPVPVQQLRVSGARYIVLRRRRQRLDRRATADQRDEPSRARTQANGSEPGTSESPDRPPVPTR